MNLWKEKWQPMLLTESKEPFQSKDFIFEIKFDGIRANIFANKKNIIIKSRNGHDMTALYPELQKIKEIINTDTILDGEIVAFEHGYPSFEKLQKRIHLKDKKKISIQSQKNPVLFICFDIIYENKDLTKLSLLERKKRLNKLKDNEVFTKITFIEKEGIKLFNTIKKMKLEGVIAKRKDSIYEPNTRTENWIKIKNIKEEKFYIGGFIEKEKNNIISLILVEKKNNNFNYIGKVTLSKKNKLYNKLKKEPILKKSYISNYNENGIFIDPKITCNVEYLEKTKSGHLRHAKLKD